MIVCNSLFHMYMDVVSFLPSCCNLSFPGQLDNKAESEVYLFHMVKTAVVYFYI